MNMTDYTLRQAEAFLEQSYDGWTNVVPAENIGDENDEPENAVAYVESDDDNLRFILERASIPTRSASHGVDEEFWIVAMDEPLDHPYADTDAEGE